MALWMPCHIGLPVCLSTCWTELRGIWGLHSLPSSTQMRHHVIQALSEADAVRPAISSPAFLEKDVANTQELVGAKRLAAEEAAE